MGRVRLARFEGGLWTVGIGLAMAVAVLAGLIDAELAVPLRYHRHLDPARGQLGQQAGRQVDRVFVTSAQNTENPQKCSILHPRGRHVALKWGVPWCERYAAPLANATRFAGPHRAPDASPSGVIRLYPASNTPPK